MKGRTLKADKLVVSSGGREDDKVLPNKLGILPKLTSEKIQEPYLTVEIHVNTTVTIVT